MRNRAKISLWGARSMKRRSAIGFALLALGLGGPWLGAQGQRSVVIRAGQLFDGKSDRLLSNQVIVIQGDRIAEVGRRGASRSLPRRRKSICGAARCYRA
jgi:hypothetical protein